VQLFAANNLHVFFSLKPLWRSDKLSAVYYVFDPPNIKNIRRFPVNISHKQLGPLVLLRTLQTVGTIKYPCIWFVCQPYLYCFAMCVCVCVWVCMCGFCNVCIFVSFIMCCSFGNTYTVHWLRF
jgi:hypothetical protein